MLQAYVLLAMKVAVFLREDILLRGQFRELVDKATEHLDANNNLEIVSASLNAYAEVLKETDQSFPIIIPDHISYFKESFRANEKHRTKDGRLRNVGRIDTVLPLFLALLSDLFYKELAELLSKEKIQVPEFDAQLRPPYVTNLLAKNDGTSLTETVRQHKKNVTQKLTNSLTESLTDVKQVISIKAQSLSEKIQKTHEINKEQSKILSKEIKSSTTNIKDDIYKAPLITAQIINKSIFIASSILISVLLCVLLYFLFSVGEIYRSSSQATSVGLDISRERYHSCINLQEKLEILIDENTVSLVSCSKSKSNEIKNREILEFNNSNCEQERRFIPGLTGGDGSAKTERVNGIDVLVPSYMDFFNERVNESVRLYNEFKKWNPHYIFNVAEVEHLNVSQVLFEIQYIFETHPDDFSERALQLPDHIRGYCEGILKGAHRY